MVSHFFDLETIIRSDSKIWVVDKSKPSFCLLKVDQSDFNLIRSGIYRKQGNLIRFAGVDYYLPDEIMNKIKIVAKNMKANTSNLAFSMREFIDPDYIGTVNHTIDVGAISHLRNTQDDVYFICSRKSKKSYESLIDKVEEKLADLGIKPKYYFISEVFYERDDDSTSFDKVRLLLQHSVGFKSDGRKFTDEPVVQYDEVYFYDEDSRTVQLAKDASAMLYAMIDNSESGIGDMIKSLLKEKSPTIMLNLVTPNLRSRLITQKVHLNSRHMMTFESYRHFL